MKQKISFKNFKHVEWKSTLWIGLLRSIAAGIIWGILIFVTRGTSSNIPIYMPFLMPLLFPLVYYIFILPFTSVLNTLGKHMSNILGTSMLIMSALLSISVCIGDPIIFILWKINKKIVPVDKFNFINLNTILFVMKEEYFDGKKIDSEKYQSEIEQQKVKTEQKSKKSCPYANSITLKNTLNEAGPFFVEDGVLGVAPSKITIEIKDNWEVYILGKRFGWVDEEGGIHNTIPDYDSNGSVYFKATLGGGLVSKIDKNGNIYFK